MARSRVGGRPEAGVVEERTGREAPFVLALARTQVPNPPHPASLSAAWAPTPDTADAGKPPQGGSQAPAGFGREGGLRLALR